MLYTINQGNVPNCPEGQTPILHLVTTAEMIEGNALAFVFTDGHAVVNYSTFYDSLEDLDKVDWEIMKATIWKDTIEDGDRKRRRQAEFLIYEFLPWKLITEIGAIDRQIQQQVQEILQSMNHRTHTKLPNITRGRALIIALFDRYGIPGYRLGRLEVQKLAYFLQEAGEPLRLQYVKHFYGPYAENLNHVLQHIDGHYIRGYGDRSRTSQIYVLPKGQEAAEAFLKEHQDAYQRLEQVSQLIEGFETPYGMEMLATLHWVAKENPQAGENVEVAIAGVQAWSDRFPNLFKPEHLRKAWKRLQDRGWFRA